MNGTWEKQTGRYASGENYRCGKIVVGSAVYSVACSKNDANKYDCHCLLPGIKQSGERYATLDEAKARLERMVTAWFTWVQS